MFPSRLLFATITLAVISSPGYSQPASLKPKPSMLIVGLISHIGDKNLSDDLKLTDEQVKKLTDYRQKGFDAAYTTPPAEFATSKEEREKALLSLLKGVLTPAQMERGTQLMAQKEMGVWTGFYPNLGPPGRIGPQSGSGSAPEPPKLLRIPAYTFLQHPEIAEAAKLTAEQRKVVEAATQAGFPSPGGPGGGRGGFGSPFGYMPPKVVLTPDQSAALLKFLGPITTHNYQEFTDDRPFRGNQFGAIGGGGPGWANGYDPRTGNYSPIGILGLKLVQAELKLTPEQIKTVSDLQKRIDASISDSSNLSPAMAEAKGKEDDARFDAVVKQTLASDQAMRLEQILKWISMGGPSHEPAIYRHPELAKALGITPEQTKALDEAAKVYGETVAKAFESDEPIDAVKKKLAAAAEARSASLDKIVGADQRAKLKELFGAEFRNSRLGGGLGSPGVDFNEYLKQQRKAGFGRYSTELTQLGRPQFSGELKLTDEQKKKVADAVKELLDTFTPSPPGSQTAEEIEKMASERSAFVEKALASILSPEQLPRFRELMVQYREQLAVGRGFGSTFSTIGLPDIADQVKLSPAQKGKIIDGTDPAEILTADQKAMIKKLAGEPYNGDLIGMKGGPGRLRAQPSFRISTLDTGRFDAELKVTPDQAYKLALELEAYSAKVREMSTGAGAGRTADTLRKAQEDALAVCEKALDAILFPEQKARLAQLERQAMAQSSMTAAIALPAVAAKLDLTAEQKKKLEAISADYRDRLQLASQTLANSLGRGQGGLGQDYPAYFTISSRLRERGRDQVMANLTEAQKAAWKELTGELSKLPLSPAPGGFGGPGGSPVGP